MKKVITIASVAMVALSLTSCMNSKETPTTFKTNEKLESVNVKTKIVEAREVPQLVEFTANVEAYKVQNLAPQAPTRIRKINVEVGDHVSPNQVLVEFDETNLAQVKFQMENQKIEVDRMKRLAEAGGIAQSNLDAILTQYSVLENSYKNLLENAQLRAPISGIVTARNYDAGDLYQGTPVLQVQQISTVKLLLDVNEQYYRFMKVGMPIENITIDAFPGETFTGHVSIIYPTINQTTRSFQVELRVENGRERLRPGMFARVTLDMGTAFHVLVPDQAVVKQTGSGERFVYVINGNQAFHRTITLGRRIDDMYEVKEGLSNGEEVVVFGQTLLTDGREVNILN